MTILQYFKSTKWCTNNWDHSETWTPVESVTCFSEKCFLQRLNTAAPEGHQGQISGCDNGQNVWTHANGLWEQELSQTRGTVQIHVREKSACSLCGAATGGRLNFVPIMTRIKAQNRVWENSRTPPLPLPLSNFPSTAQRVLSLYLSMFLSNSCAFSLFPLLQTNAWNQPAGASDSERERERKHMRL